MTDLERSIATSLEGRRPDLNSSLALIWPLLGRHIAFHRRLVDITASVKAALLLSQAIYWTRHGKDVAASGGWFFKTTTQWNMETGLSLKEQFGARCILRKLAILDERRHGLPAKLHFRLAAEKLASLLSARVGAASGSLDWSDGAAVAELLGPALAYHRVLATVAGGVNAGILLSRALHLTRVQSKIRPDGWIGRSMAQWMHDVGLTRREQETARRELARLGIWEESIKGIPPRVFVRVRMQCLKAILIAHAASNRAGRSHLKDREGGGIAHSRPAQNGESRERDYHLLALPKAPTQEHQKRHLCSDKSAATYIEGSTSGLVQPLLPVQQESEEIRKCGAELVFPYQLSPEERSAARALIRDCGDSAQQLLDELAARLQANAIRTSALAYLRGMVARAHAGRFVPELGIQIAAARRRNHEDSVRRAARDAEARRSAAERATPEYQAKLVRRRSELRSLLATIQSAHSRKKRP